MLTPSDPRAIARYVVEDSLPPGGMGIVYVARDPQLGRQVAIKLIQAQFDSTDGRARFEKEARSIAALNHPNIVNIYDLGEFESRPFIVLEYITGRSLDAVIRERQPVGLAARLRWLEELGEGLQFAHDRGIIHRDIKPANLMLDHLDRLRILDFGIARIAGTSSTHMSSMLGTPAYMAPEYVLDLQLDHRADIFAVGAVAYELLTFQPAFPGRTPATIIQKILECKPRRMSEASALVDPELEAVVMRALQRDPEARYQSAREFVDAVRTIRTQLDAPSTALGTSPSAAIGEWQSEADRSAFESAASHLPAAGDHGGLIPDTVVVPGATVVRRPDGPPPIDETVVLDHRAEGAPPPPVVRASSSSTPGDRSPVHRRYAIAAIVILAVGAAAVAMSLLAPFGTGGSTSPNDPPLKPTKVQVDSRSGQPTNTITTLTPAPPPIKTGASGTSSVSSKSATPDGPATSAAPTTGRTATTGPVTAEIKQPVPTPEINPPVKTNETASTMFFQPRVRASAGESSAAAATPPVSLSGLRYRLLQRTGESTERAVDADTVFMSGDEVRFSFESNADGYLYVIQQGSSGNWTVLFPHPDINGGRNHVAAFQRHITPSDFWYEFDERPGTEQVFVYFSKKPEATLPGFDRPVTKEETVPNASVEALQAQVRTRDLIIEKTSAAKAGSREGTYIVNRDELANAVAITFRLEHK